MNNCSNCGEPLNADGTRHHNDILFCAFVTPNIRWEDPRVARNGEPTRCAPLDCKPDKSGYCIYCRHEVLTEVDDDGNPVNQDDCNCTESQIVAGCSLHDGVQYTPHTT